MSPDCECCGEEEGQAEPVRLSPVVRPQDLDDGCCAPTPALPGEELTVEEMTPWWRDRTVLLPAVSGVLLAGAFVSGRAGLGTAEPVLEGAALLAGAWTFVPGALRRLAYGRLGVGLLMTIAAVGAVLLGQLVEAAALAFLFSIAEALESRAMAKARHGLHSLLALMPHTARVVREGQEVVVAAADVRIGDVLVLGAGERVATDGVVLEGCSSLDTSAVTGESIPVEVGAGEPVPAGSVNGAGTLRVRATADGQDNSLTQIVRLVEQAHARKGERARLADRIARPLVPMILALSAAVALAGLFTDQPATWIERALVVLVAASPCAMAIAVPVTVISAIGAASRLGVVIKSGEAFERLGTIRRVAFDKTGTLTRNRPQVVEVHAVAEHSQARVLGLAAALEATSTHPLAEAILAAAARVPRATGVQEQAGHGVSGVVEGDAVRLGSPRWVDPGVLAPPVAAMTGRGMTVVVVEARGEPVGAIGIRDELKPEAGDAVRMLAASGVAVLMLTGDNARTARALAAEIGIDDVRAEQLPADKSAAVEQLARTRPTAMIGDGINDAPALAAATVGIAMGVTGSAAAVESADVAFTGTDLRLIPRALDHARRGRRIMTGNIGLALAIIVVLVPLALVGVLSLAQVVLVHEAAEVVVILNGLRAARTANPMPTPSAERRELLRV